tara:strand:+ start:195 stop:503 length:309 start_codon:yes stop_codon:yes gene_type:complete
MVTLREVIGQGKLNQSVAKRKGEASDADVCKANLRSMAGKLKEASEASSQNDCDDLSDEGVEARVEDRTDRGREPRVGRLVRRGSLIAGDPSFRWDDEVGLG